VLKLAVKTVGMDIVSRNPVIVLRNEDGPEIILIATGKAEAQAIMYKINNISLPRPFTYDLMENVLKELSIDLHQVVMNKIHDNILYSQIELHQDEDTFIVDSRPSDAIALALWTNSPIYSTEEVAAQIMLKESTLDNEAEDEQKRFREFLNDLRPEDFGN